MSVIFLFQTNTIILSPMGPSITFALQKSHKSNCCNIFSNYN